MKYITKITIKSEEEKSTPKFVKIVPTSMGDVSLFQDLNTERLWCIPAFSWNYTSDEQTERVREIMLEVIRTARLA